MQNYKYMQLESRLWGLFWTLVTCYLYGKGYHAF